MARTHLKKMIGFPATSTPVVSIIMFCRNGAKTICRAVDSVLNSTYKNIELVVQDGQSTDGTIELLQRYGDRIKLVSEPDDGPSDAFHKALPRCSGDIVGSCLADEELLPDAIAEAVHYFGQHPDTGALSGDVFLTDDLGRATGEASGRDFDLLDYLLGLHTPYFCASFFSRAALRSIGYLSDDVDFECFEFELWTRLATRHCIAYVPRKFAKYAIHDAQLSNTPRAILPHIEARTGVVRRIFSAQGFFGDNAELRDYVLLAQYRMFYAHAVTYHLGDVISDLRREITALSPGGNESRAASDWIAKQNARQLWLRLGSLAPARLKRWILNKRLHLYVRPFVLRILSRSLSKDGAATAQENQGATEERAQAMMRATTAMIFSERGQIEAALDLWRRAETLRDIEIDSLACQAAQKAPSFSGSKLYDIQRKWAQRHANYPYVSPSVLRGNSLGSTPINVGYHCAWWDSVTARRQLLNFIQHHDRAKIRPFCYSPISVPPDVARHFEAVRVTGRLSDEEFAAVVQSDKIDILLETTGFSPFHRYAAMARRCAPIQISYLNHHATTGVNNIDYVLGDEIVANGPDRNFFTEEIYALPGCFFCFDLRNERIPFKAESPCVEKGHVTFGCFGTGGKINLRLIEMWAAILRRAPNSRLFLRNRELTPVDNRRFMEQRFDRFGVGPDRLTLLGGTSNNTILQNYADVDISLDTWPYCGGNTIAESFWQGVPVVTLLGDRFSARYGASLVYAHGCAELVADSEARYVEIAAGLAQDRPRLEAYRRRARQLAGQFGFNDSEGFARKLENAYQEMLRRLHDSVSENDAIVPLSR